MAFRTSDFLNRVYHERRYNCVHFAAEVWAVIDGRDLYNQLREFIECAVSRRKIQVFKKLGLNKLKEPVSPCLVFMHNKFDDLHIGVFIKGNLFHIRETGPEFLPFPHATRGYGKFRYYQ